MIEWLKNSRIGKWLMQHKWARRGLLAFLAFELAKSLVWTAIFVAIWLGYKSN